MGVEISSKVIRFSFDSEYAPGPVSIAYEHEEMRFRVTRNGAGTHAAGE
jgi:hypothetical protein